MAIHIGSLIEKEAGKQNIGATELGRRINTVRENIYDIYSRPSLDTQQLFDISIALQHNFFNYYSESDPLKNINSTEIEKLNNQIIDLYEQLTRKNSQISELNDIISLLEKKLKLLENK